MNGTPDEHFLRRRAWLAAAAASGAAALWPAAAALGAASPEPAASPPAADLDALLQAAMSGRAVPAMAALAIRGGEAGPLACRGRRSVDSPDPVRAGDAWHIGSCSKAMTATVIARLVERGSLAWSTPLATLLPDLAEGMQPAYREVTLVDLLSHRAGLPENPPIERLLAYFDDTRPLPAQRLDYARLALGEAPAAPPRTAFVYSNSGYVIAGLAAERASGQPWERLIRAELFDPLALRSAGLGATRPGQPAGHEGGRPSTGPRSGNPAVLAPAGDVHMSLEDWSVFVIDQMRGESGSGRLLQPPTYRLLHAPVPGTRSALGWGVRDGAPATLTHTGSDGAWFAALAMVPSKGNAVLVAANAAADAGGDAAVLQVLKGLLPTLAQG
jgi:CubicO group peptidase (beta-lactamase class C family)